jgi:hypothetical protein
LSARNQLTPIDDINITSILVLVVVLIPSITSKRCGIRFSVHGKVFHESIHGVILGVLERLFSRLSHAKQLREVVPETT